MNDLLTDDFDCYDDEDPLTDDASAAADRWAAAWAHELRGECMEALILYSQGFNALTEDEKCCSGWAQVMLNGRRRMKWALGVKLDGLEVLADVGAVERTNIYLDVLDLLREPRISHGEVHVWSRSELVGTHEDWPVRISLDSIVDYYHEVERGLRRLNEPVLVMHRTAAFFFERIDEAQPLLRESGQVLTAIKWPRDDVVGVAWPPGRNQSCWCGSGVKYKRCCGAAALQGNGDVAWGPTRLRGGAGLAVCRV
ncbi:SEC-C domain-containing protein [Kribbella sp. NBC_01505]|uniref:SEC-C domain-containing protein n=1 Tax=Kribbella sp. NBC_01505 TaxID=2903580 RepID=UPI003863CF94